MRTIRNLFFWAILASFAVACSSNDDKVGDWEKVETFGGKGRLGAISFTIGDKVYVGLGVDAEGYELNDMWTFGGYSWGSDVDTFPGPKRWGAVAFSDGQYGYVGTGYAQNQHISGSKSEYFNDFWRFDPTQPSGSQWKKLNDFPGQKRRYAVAFYVDGHGYIGTGYGDDKAGTFKDFWRYDAPSDSWTQINGFGEPRQGAVAWVIGKSAYICTGVNGSSDYVTDFLKFTPAKEEPWEKLDPLRNLDHQGFDNHYAKIPRAYAVAFVVGKEEDKSLRVYLASGGRPALLTDCWEFDPYKGEMGRWDEVTNLTSVMTRVSAVSFTIKGLGYMTTGGSSISSFTSVRQSTYIFYPGVKDDDQNDD